MIALSLCGAAAGAALTALWFSLRPAPRPLPLELARIRMPAPARPTGHGLSRVQARVGTGVVRRLEGWRLFPGGLRADLAVISLPAESWAAQVTLGGLSLMVLGVAAVAGCAALGLAIPPVAGAGIVVLLGVAAVCIPAQEVHARAVRARAHFRQVFVTWLELVTLGQAAGAGLEGAMAAACELGDDWALRRIAGALTAGRSAGVGPWEGLRGLAVEVGLDDLARVAASLSLAGTEGARVRASLSATAGSLRARTLSETEGRANALTERLFLPAIILAAGFMLFILYPALSRVLGSLGGG